MYEFSSFTQFSPLLIFIESLIARDDISMKLSLINHIAFFIGSIEIPLSYVQITNMKHLPIFIEALEISYTC